MVTLISLAVVALAGAALYFLSKKLGSITPTEKRMQEYLNQNYGTPAAQIVQQPGSQNQLTQMLSGTASQQEEKPDPEREKREAEIDAMVANHERLEKAGAQNWVGKFVYAELYQLTLEEVDQMIESGVIPQEDLRIQSYLPDADGNPSVAIRNKSYV